MMIVLAIVLIMSGIGFVSLQPVVKDQRVANGYNTALSAMRLARDNAIAQRTSYGVTFNTATNPHTVTVAPMFAGFQGAHAPVTYQLPFDIRFDNEPGIPTNTNQTPDGFGTGGQAIDFGYTSQGGAGGQKAIYFCPDGSAQDTLAANGLCQGNFSNGVVYIARPAELMSSRALTVWGATGRIRGWRLQDGGAGGVKWQRQ
jgi:type II secretory pathway pseudopilin PulG